MCMLKHSSCFSLKSKRLLSNVLSSIDPKGYSAYCRALATLCIHISQGLFRTRYSFLSLLLLSLGIDTLLKWPGITHLAAYTQKQDNLKYNFLEQEMDLLWVQIIVWVYMLLRPWKPTHVIVFETECGKNGLFMESLRLSFGIILKDRGVKTFKILRTRMSTKHPSNKY